MADPITITISGVSALLASGGALYIIPLIRKSRANRPLAGANASGDKDPSYWKQEFREAQIDVNKLQVLPILDGLAKGQEKQTAIMESLARTQEGFAAMLAELVDVSRKRRR